MVDDSELLIAARAPASRSVLRAARTDGKNLLK
jgi:hypothetical protein